MNITEDAMREIESLAHDALEEEMEAREAKEEGMPIDEAAFFVARFAVNAALSRGEAA